MNLTVSGFFLQRAHGGNGGWKNRKILHCLHALFVTIIFIFPLTLTAAPLSPYQAAFVAYKSGQLDDALRGANALLAGRPADGEALLLKARVLVKQGKHREAEACLLTISGGEQTPPEVSYWLGEAAFGQEHWGEAVQCYRACLDKKPDHQQAILKTIYCHAAAGDLPAAAKLIIKLDPADEQSPAYYYAHAALASATGKAADVQQSLRQARTLHGNTVCNEYEPDWLFTLNKLKP